MPRRTWGLSNRMVRVCSTRCWRSGLPTVIASNASKEDAAQLTEANKQHNEIYLHVEDEAKPDKLNKSDRAHSRRSGDVRAALLPTLAHEALGGAYEWLLYGDDVGLCACTEDNHSNLPLTAREPLALSPGYRFVVCRIPCSCCLAYDSW